MALNYPFVQSPPAYPVLFWSSTVALYFLAGSHSRALFKFPASAHDFIYLRCFSRALVSLTQLHFKFNIGYSGSDCGLSRCGGGRGGARWTLSRGRRSRQCKYVPLMQAGQPPLTGPAAATAARASFDMAASA